MTTASKDTSNQDEEREEKVKELREIIANAQETISSATQLLSAIQGISPDEPSSVGNILPEDEDGQTIYGYFDGQIMIGDDGKQYPVPANYASKSKLVEGDKLKLTITTDNRFVYKQIGPVQRNYLIGLVKEDAKGNFSIKTPEKEYQVLLAAATYFKIEAGDEVTLIVPQGKTTIWGAIENVLQKNTLASVGIGGIQSTNTMPPSTTEDNQNIDDSTIPSTTENNIPAINTLDITNDIKSDKINNQSENKSQELTAIEKLEIELERERSIHNNDEATSSELDKNVESPSSKNEEDIWTSDIEKLKQEAGIAVTQ